MLFRSKNKGDKGKTYRSKHEQICIEKEVREGFTVKKDKNSQMEAKEDLSLRPRC